MVVDEELKQWIKKGEGIKLRPYLDSVNKWTIGYGRNLSDKGISLQEAEYMFDNDINLAAKELENYEWYRIQPQGVKQALINMNFNMGLSRLLKFQKMIMALINKNYTQAALEALESKWAEQVPSRAKDIATMIRNGK
jgi:lysozyme